VPITRARRHTWQLGRQPRHLGGNNNKPMRFKMNYKNCIAHFMVRKELGIPIKNFDHLLIFNHLSLLGRDELKNLKWLNLEYSQLHSIPKEIGELKSLEWFDLNNNQLHSIPKEIGELKSLERLYLQNNQLSKQHQEEIRAWLPNCEIYF
jgi:hypothetical protein